MEKCYGVGEIDGFVVIEFVFDVFDIDVIYLCCGYFFSNLLFDFEVVKVGWL